MNIILGASAFASDFSWLCMFFLCVQLNGYSNHNIMMRRGRSLCIHRFRLLVCSEISVTHNNNAVNRKNPGEDSIKFFFFFPKSSHDVTHLLLNYLLDCEMLGGDLRIGEICSLLLPRSSPRSEAHRMFDGESMFALASLTHRQQLYVCVCEPVWACVPLCAVKQGFFNQFSPACPRMT